MVILIAEKVDSEGFGDGKKLKPYSMITFVSVRFT